MASMNPPDHENENESVPTEAQQVSFSEEMSVLAGLICLFCSEYLSPILYTTITLTVVDS